MNVNKLTVNNPGYPNILRHTSDPPAVLYWQGQPPQSWLDRPKVAVVGSRKPSAYGKAVTDKLVRELVLNGVVIISGLAYGIDITAHKAAVAAGGTTVAVLPSSLDRIYPTAHTSIARQIASRGTLVTEYPKGSIIAFKSNFIARNRIVSGLADAVLIPEAALKSGSLHTARFALEQGRTVMSVPGNITSPTSEGCNNLIKSGAVPITSVDDILFALKLPLYALNHQKKLPSNDLEATVYQLIREGTTDLEELMTAVSADTPTVSNALTMLEISGYIRPAGAGNWVIA